MNPSSYLDLLMRQTVFSICFLTALPATAIASDVAARALMPAKHEELFKKYCYECHDAANAEAMVDLESLPFEISRDVEVAERWAKVLNAINSGEMPPPDLDQIAGEAKKDFLKDLSEQMVVARKILSDSGGVITLRRLNRREYSNTIESLLGVRPDVSSLPNDQSASGFDTQGASLFISSDQIEQYLASARHSLKLSLLPRKQPATRTIRIQPEEEYTQRYATAAEEMRDIKRRSEAFLSQSEKPASDFGFLDAYQAKKQGQVSWLPRMDDYVERQETQTGATLIMTIKQGGYTRIKLPMMHEMQEGKYRVRIRAAAYPDARERLHYLEFTTSGGASITRLGWRKVTAPLSDPQIIEFHYEHHPGEKKQIVIHQRSHQDRADKNQNTIDMKANGIGTPPGLWVDWAELIGPEPDERREKIRSQVLFEKPPQWSDQQYAFRVIESFAIQAFRGAEPNPEYLEKLTARFTANREKGQALNEALLDPLSIILSSPSFLYMIETTGNEKSESLTGAELAVRLSYFLWSSPPDEELMRLGKSGRLLQKEVLKAQTERLLADSRSEEFIHGFVHQWLHMDRLGMFQFDGVQFPTFDNAARELAGKEIYETFNFVLKEGLPLDRLLKSDFVVINDLLAGYYGIPGVEGHEFRGVTVPAGSPRGGLLGTAAIHAMGSDGQRSSPVERGAWVLRKLLNDPPPPAPPNVPMLSRLQGDNYSARELADAHQEQPQCANCHQNIDPIGMGLENFTAVGLWRQSEVLDKRGRNGMRVKLAEFEITPYGRLPDGSAFEDFYELRDAIAKHDEDFKRGFTEALVSYGLGRPFGFTDQDLANQILERGKQQGNQVSAFISALVQSKEFRTK
ncbi:MAG: DUF1592 domain-containing protein [Planctomycetota bacterium]